MNKIYVLCEGYSEKIYINALMSLLHNNEVYGFSIISININGGSSYDALFKNIKSEIKSLKKSENDLKNKIYIWNDKDVFERKYKAKLNKFVSDIEGIKLPQRPKILFNYMNFEDFLILHYGNDKILELQNKLINKNKNHFIKPLIAIEYEPIFKSVITDYKKGSLPDDFELNLEILKQCIANIDNQEYNFSSEIKEILQLVVDCCEKGA